MEKARVSSVLDFFCEPYLLKWKLTNKDWQKVSERALVVGSMIDNAVQADINQNGTSSLYHTDTDINNCWKAWEKFKKERPDVLARLITYKQNMQMELVLGDLVGHPDFILDDEVIDLKTSKQVSKSHWMQTAQYAHMTMEDRFAALLAGGIDNSAITKISILRLDKLTGEYEYKTLEEPFISFWQRKFQARYECFKEEQEFVEMQRKQLEMERLA